MSKRESGVMTVGAVLVVGMTAVFLTPRDTVAPWPTAQVRDGVFLDTIVETGTVSAARLMLYSAPVGGGQSKIVWIVPEGESVAAGAELVRFDDSGLRQSLEKELAAWRRSEADLLRAREELRIEQIRAQGDLEAAAQAVGFAERELANQMEGKGRLAVIEAEAAAAEAERELAQLKSSYEDIKALLPEGFVTRSEVEKAGQLYLRGQEQLRLAKFKVETLARFERPSALDRSMADVNNARGDLNRANETAGSRVAQRRAALTSAQGQVDEIKARIDALNSQLERTVLRADAPGLVVYRELYFGGDRRKPQVGDEVWPNQPLIALPDSSQLTVDTRVREIDLHKVAASQKVQVRFDAYPDLQLPASVSLVGALAQEDGAKAGTKYFPVTVKLLANDERLRTGMTAQVNIEVSPSRAARLIPVEAVFGDPQAPYAVVLRANSPARRPIVVGAMNATEADVRRGLEAGESVLLTDPTQ